MKRFRYALLLSFLSFVCAYGQYNNVFIVDCSRSMLCPNAEQTGDWNTEEPDIRWKPAKQAIKEWIESYENNDIITMLLFNDSVVATIGPKKKKDIHWDDIDRELDKAVEVHHGKTSICNAWSVAEKYFDPSKYNFFYIITDGIDDHIGPCKLVNQIRAFCGKMPEGSYGYVLKLDHASFPQEILDALNSSPCLTQLPLGPIPIFGGFLTDEVTVVTSNMKTGGSDTTSPLKFNRKSKYSISCIINDPYFNVAVTNGVVNNGKLTFDVSLKEGININNLKQQLNTNQYVISVTLNSDQLTYIHNNEISIIVTLKPITELQLFTDVSQIELGKTTWYDKFIISGTQPDTLSYYLRPRFNREALSNNSSVVMKVDNMNPNMRLLVNGFLTDTFTVSSNDPIRLQFVTISPCEDFDIESSLSVIRTTNLDRISGDKKITLCGEVRHKMNPLKQILIWISFVLLIGLVLRVLYNLIIRSSMSGKMNIVDEYDKTIKGLGEFTGFHKVYLYGGADKRKSNILDCLLLSNRKYIHISNLPTTIKITGNSNKTIWIHPTNGIMLNGNTIVLKTSIKAKSIFTLSWNDNNHIKLKYF